MVSYFDERTKITSFDNEILRKMFGPKRDEQVRSLGY
jgi:hypothetical protein